MVERQGRVDDVRGRRPGRIRLPTGALRGRALAGSGGDEGETAFRPRDPQEIPAADALSPLAIPFPPVSAKSEQCPAPSSSTEVRDSRDLSSSTIAPSDRAVGEVGSTRSRAGPETEPGPAIKRGPFPSRDWRLSPPRCRAPLPSPRGRFPRSRSLLRGKGSWIDRRRRRRNRPRREGSRRLAKSRTDPRGASRRRSRALWRSKGGASHDQMDARSGTGRLRDRRGHLPMGMESHRMAMR